MLHLTLSKKDGGLKRERDISSAQFTASAAASDDNTTTSRASKTHKTSTAAPKQELPPRAAPYFFYTDHSRDVDDDPLTPVTPPNSVPSFPIKLHAILSMPEYSDILAWDTHGRSFRILKPKRFERDLVPRFFEHTKLSSFTRQVNGWGFRRLMEGANMGSYYEENFLRSMPWLVKNMKRPKVGEKKSFGAQYEPDLAAISEEFPVPNHPMTREIQVVLETIKKGAKAKMPENMLLIEDELGLATLPSSVGIDTNLKPAGQPEYNAHANMMIAAAAAAVPTAQDRKIPTDNGAVLRTLFQTVHQNTGDRSLAALLNMPQFSATSASVPPAQAPSSDLMNLILQNALQQQSRRDSIAAAPMLNNQASYATGRDLIGAAAQLRIQNNHASSMPTSHNLLAQPPRLISPEHLLQCLQQKTQASAVPTTSLHGVAAPSIRQPNNHAHNTLNVIHSLLGSQLQGMTTDQLQWILKRINRDPPSSF